jgi:hypothetical protein
MRSVCIGVTCPIRVHPTPEDISLFHVVSKKDALVTRAKETQSQTGHVDSHERVMLIHMGSYIWY